MLWRGEEGAYLMNLDQLPWVARGVSISGVWDGIGRKGELTVMVGIYAVRGGIADVEVEDVGSVLLGYTFTWPVLCKVNL